MEAEGSSVATVQAIADLFANRGVPADSYDSAAADEVLAGAGARVRWKFGGDPERTTMAFGAESEVAGAFTGPLKALESHPEKAADIIKFLDRSLEARVAALAPSLR